MALCAKEFRCLCYLSTYINYGLDWILSVCSSRHFASVMSSNEDWYLTGCMYNSNKAGTITAYCPY